MNQREQLASENGMAIEFVNWFFDNKKDGCGNVWFMMMAAMWEGWTAREAQVKQLAAENAALKQSEIEYDNTCRQEFGDDWVSEFTETPATDAILASLRAEGVEMLAAIAGNECKRYKSINDRAGLRKWKSIVILCSDFAAQLRSKSEVQHD